MLVSMFIPEGTVKFYWMDSGAQGGRFGSEIDVNGWIGLTNISCPMEGNST